MRWGVRRYQNSDGSLTAAGRKRYGVKEVGSSEKRSEDLSSLSDEELRSYINRRNLEKQYRNLKDEEASSNKTTSTKTKKKVSEMTDQELRDYLSRRNMEKQYNKATDPIYAVGTTLAVVGGVVLTARLNKKMNLALDKGESAALDILKKLMSK